MQIFAWPMLGNNCQFYASNGKFVSHLNHHLQILKKSTQEDSFIIGKYLTNKIKKASMPHEYQHVAPFTHCLGRYLLKRNQLTLKVQIKSDSI